MLEKTATILPKKDWFKNSFEIDRLPVVAQTGINSVGDIHRAVYSIAESLRDKKPLGVEVSLGELVGQLESRLDFLEERHTLEERIALSAQINVAREGIQSLRAHAEWLAKQETVAGQKNAEPAAEKDWTGALAVASDKIQAIVREYNVLFVQAKNEKFTHGQASVELQSRIRQLLFTLGASLPSEDQTGSRTDAQKKLAEKIQSLQSLLATLEATIRSQRCELDQPQTQQLEIVLARIGVSAGDYTAVSVLGSGKEGTVVLLKIHDPEKHNLPPEIVAKIQKPEISVAAKEFEDFTVQQNLLLEISCTDTAYPVPQQYSYIPRSFDSSSQVALMEMVAGLSVEDYANVPVSWASKLSALQAAHWLHIMEKRNVANRDAKVENFIISANGLKIIDLGTYLSLDGRLSNQAFVKPNIQEEGGARKSEKAFPFRHESRLAFVKLAATCCLSVEQRQPLFDFLGLFGKIDPSRLSKEKRYQIGLFLRSNFFTGLPTAFQKIVTLSLDVTDSQLSDSEQSSIIFQLTRELADSRSNAAQVPAEIKPVWEIFHAMPNNLQTNVEANLISFPDSPNLSNDELGLLQKRKAEAFVMGEGGIESLGSTLEWFSLVFMPGPRLMETIIGNAKLYSRRDGVNNEFASSVKSNEKVVDLQLRLQKMQDNKKDTDSEHVIQFIEKQMREVELFKPVYEEMLSQELQLINLNTLEDRLKQKAELKKYTITAFLNLRNVLLRSPNFDSDRVVNGDMERDRTVLRFLGQMDDLFKTAAKSASEEGIKQFKVALNAITRDLMKYLSEQFGVQKSS